MLSLVNFIKYQININSNTVSNTIMKSQIEYYLIVDSTILTGRRGIVMSHFVKKTEDIIYC